jgi:hypothetical protein
MRDFRKFIRPDPGPSYESVAVLFASGDLIRGAKQCARVRAEFSDFTAEIREGAKLLLYRGQAGYILSFIRKYRVDTGFDIAFLLGKMLESGDNETNFLKHVHQFRHESLFRTAVGEAILCLREKKQNGSASAWERKMSEIRGLEPIDFGNV